MQVSDGIVCKIAPRSDISRVQSSGKLITIYCSGHEPLKLEVIQGLPELAN
jgi:hypothetical protein